MLHITISADDAFHEIQLSGKQLVFLFMATTIVAVVIFLCGVQVGRGVRRPRPTRASRDVGDVAVVARTTPPATARRSRPPRSRRRPPKDADEDLSYAKRLQAEGQPTEKVKPHADDPPTCAPPPVSDAHGVDAAASRAAAAHKDAPQPVVKETPAKAIGRRGASRADLASGSCRCRP